jgi:hypothetical protein
MSGRNCDSQELPAHQLLRQRRSDNHLAERRHQREIEPTIKQSGRLLVNEASLDLYLGPPSAKLHKDRRQHGAKRTGKHPDAHGADRPLSDATHHFHRLVETRNHAAGLCKEPCAGVGQQDTSMRALKELKSQIAFEDPDLLAQRRLCDMHARGRATKVKLLSDCDEIAQLADIHR